MGSSYFSTNARGRWGLRVGRLGGAFDPIMGGWFAAAGIGGSTAFYIYGRVNLVGAPDHGPGPAAAQA
jgi:AAHS family benzoate transporter-like MFS transporter